MLWPSPAWDDVTYWALDLETGGLDVKRDAILAVGMLPLRAGTIRLGEAYESLVRPEGAFRSESVQAHQLVPHDLVQAPPLPEVLREIDGRLSGSVLLVHNAEIDVRFLQRAHRQAGLRWPGPRVVDTVALLARVARKARFIDPDAPHHEFVANLAEARRRHGLPDYGVHDALTDALATAELFLVLRRALSARTLRELR